MSSEAVNVIAIITPNPDYKEKALGAFTHIAGEVEKNDPDCLVYRVHESSDGDFVIFQQYRNMAAFEAHKNSKYSKDVKAAADEHNGLQKEPFAKVFTSKAAAGFGPRA